MPIEESVGAMAELVNEGKVAHLGLSEVSAAAADVQLTGDQLRELDEAFAPGVTAGDRYTPDGMASVEL
jgi:hypothetical protein